MPMAKWKVKKVVGVPKFTLDNPNAYGTSAGDKFGNAIDASETYIIVGTEYEGPSQTGKAYIYGAASGNLLRTLVNPNGYGTTSYDAFGSAVSITDEYAVVGASGEDDAGGSSSGKVYIFDPSSGALLHTLNNPNVTGNRNSDSFGSAVCVRDGLVVVGAKYTEPSGALVGVGRVYVFNAETADLLYTFENPGDGYFGGSIFACSEYVAIGVNNATISGSVASGCVYVYSVASGDLLHTIVNPNEDGTAEQDYFGTSVSIDSSYIAVGAYCEESESGDSSGKVYVFSAETGEPMSVICNPNAYGTETYDSFGLSLSMKGQLLVVGAPSEDDPSANSSGKAYVFSIPAGELLCTIDNPNAYGTAAGDVFGWRVAISETVIAVSAINEDDAGGAESGKAYVYATSTKHLVRL